MKIEEKESPWTQAPGGRDVRGKRVRKKVEHDEEEGDGETVARSPRMRNELLDARRGEGGEGGGGGGRNVRPPTRLDAGFFQRGHGRMDVGINGGEHRAFVAR